MTGITDASDTDRLDGYERSLLTAVRTKQDLGRLATNPLMCGLICALHRDRRGYLPHGRKELYDAALSMLLIRRDRERDIERPDGIHLTEQPQIQLLQRLAYWLIRNGQAEMDRVTRRAHHRRRCSPPSRGRRAGRRRRRSCATSSPQRPAPRTDRRHRRLRPPHLPGLPRRQGRRGGRDFGLLVRHADDDQWEDVIRMAVAHARPDERARC